MSNSYFKEELSYLQDIRNSFLQDNPDVAPFLAAGNNDPDVERLFEGFAFLTARIRANLDDQFPEFVQGLFNFWWPHYLRAIPSISVIEFTPKYSAFSGIKCIDKGVTIKSEPVNGTHCSFSTCYDMHMYPLTINDVSHRNTTQGTIIQLEINLWPTASFTHQDNTHQDNTRQDNTHQDNTGLDNKHLQFYIDGPHEDAASIVEYLSRYLQDIEVSFKKEGSVVTQLSLDSDCVAMQVDKSDYEVLPHAENILPGYIALQEYFSFPEKCHFFDIKHFLQIAKTAEAQQAEQIVLHFHLSQTLPQHIALTNRSFKINCVPAINLFSGSARPIILDKDKKEYPLYADSPSGEALSLYSVDQVLGLKKGDSQPRVYHRFESFEQVKEKQKQKQKQKQEGQACYQIKILPDICKAQPRSSIKESAYHRGVSQQTSVKHYICPMNPDEAFFDTDDDRETLSIDITCTNHDLPNRLSLGHIQLASHSSPDYAEFKNITIPTRYAEPPLEKNLLWRLISNMSMNFHSILNKETLVNLLKTYDFPGFYDEAKRRKRDRLLESMTIDYTRPTQRLYRELVVQGIETQLSFAVGDFITRGELFIFTGVLNQFLAGFVPLNSFHELKIHNRDHGDTFEWTMKAGMKPLM